MRIVLAGGGTGGHVFPAIAVAQELRDRHPDAELVCAGSAQGLEADLVARAGCVFEPLVGPPLLSAGALRPVTAMLTNLPGAIGFLRRAQPDAVLGTGGYASAVTVLAAAVLHLPTMVLDVNAIPGRTNRLLAPLVDCIGVSFREAMAFLPAGKCVLTGTPLRREFQSPNRAASRARLGLCDEDSMLLIYGGSQGARSINQATLGALDALLRCQRMRIVHLCGRDGVAEAQGARAALVWERAARYDVREFVHNMPELIAAADVAVGRAGGSVFELAACGVPMILVPLPNARDDHQLHNARLARAAGAGLLIENRDLTPQTLITAVTRIAGNPDTRRAMSERSRGFAIPDAAMRVAMEVEALAARRGRETGAAP